MRLVLAISCHHLLRDDVDSQGESRGHKEAARLGNDGNPSRRREVQVHHRHDCAIDLQQQQKKDDSGEKAGTLCDRIGFTSETLWCPILISWEKYTDQLQLSLRASEAASDVQDFHVEADLLLRQINKCKCVTKSQSDGNGRC